MAIGGRIIDWMSDRFLDLLADCLTPAPITRRASRWARLLGRLEDWLMSKGGANGAFAAGRYYMSTNRIAAAELAFQDAESWYKRHLGPNHPWVGYAAEYRAWCYVGLGDDSKAIPLYEKALAVTEGWQGRDGGRSKAIRENLQLVQRRLDGA